MDAPQLPRTLSAAATLERQLGHARDAAPIGVAVPEAAVGAEDVAVVLEATVPPSLASSPPPVARLSSRSPSPIALPNSGSLPGPKISRTMTRMTIRWPG